MSLGNYIIIVLLVYYSMRFATFFKKGALKNNQETNEQLNDLRKIKFKTIEEQKQFLDLKFGRKEKRKWLGKDYLSFLIYFCISIALFIGYNYLLRILGIDINITLALIILILLPIIISMILNRCGLSDNNFLIDIFRKTK